MGFWAWVFNAVGEISGFGFVLGLTDRNGCELQEFSSRFTRTPTHVVGSPSKNCGCPTVQTTFSKQSAAMEGRNASQEKHVQA